MSNALFNGEVALVTGAGSGIGRATAIAFAREGARVMVADISADSAQETADLILKSGGVAVARRCDVEHEVDVASLVEQTVRHFGGLDCAFNNAGINIEFGGDWDVDQFDRTLAVNCRGIFLCMKYEIAHMLANDGGAIVNTSSINGLVGNAAQPGYVTSKHAVIGATRQAALQYGRRGIRVNAVCPGTILTAMNSKPVLGGPDAARARAEKNNPIGRIGEPAEVAEAVIWLASKRASFVTGHALAVDGGFTAA